MAKGTIVGKTDNEYISAQVIWTSTVNTDKNQSTVTATLYYKRTNDYTTYGTGSFTITINGEVTKVTNYISFGNDEWVEAMSATVTVAHDSDGSKSITISASGGIPGTSLEWTSLSGTADLGTIPRASTITAVSNTTLGNKCSVKWTPRSAAFRYKLEFKLGDWSKTTDAIHPNQTTAYIHAVTIPLDVANQLPNAKTGTMTVTLYTYSNSGATTQVGEEASKTFTATVPNNENTKPTVSMTHAAVNALGDTFAGLYIQGRSQVQAIIEGTGKYGATISSCKLYVAGTWYGAPHLSDYLPSSGTVTIKGHATDSRGYTNVIEEEITVLPYSPPTVQPPSGASAVVCSRCYSDGTLAEDGTYLRIRAKRSYSNVGGKNQCAIRYRYRSESTNTYSEWVTLLAGSDTADTVDTGAITSAIFSSETTYFVQVGVVDDIGESDAVQVTVPTDFVTIDCPEEYLGRRMGLFRHVSGTTEDGLYVGLPIFGGSIDSLKLGTRLTATAAAPISLDDIRTPGCYYSPNAENSQYIAGSPHTEGGFRLEVRELQHEAYVRQTIEFGRTTMWRHYNGTEFSEWMRAMVTPELDSACVDYVIETGASGGWNYRKYKSGFYEMFGTFQVTPTESTLNESLYRTNSIQVGVPFAITNDAVVTGTGTGHYWLTNSGYAGETAISIRVMSDKTITTTGTITVRLRVVGTYA